MCMSVLLTTIGILEDRGFVFFKNSPAFSIVPGFFSIVPGSFFVPFFKSKYLGLVYSFHI